MKNKPKKETSVLVIDDEMEMRSLFLRILEPRGCRVIIAGNAPEGLERAKAENFDVVFTDIVMPKMDGISASERLKEISPNTKIVIMSGHTENENVKRALVSGLDIFAILSKPFKIGDVIDIIERVKK